MTCKANKRTRHHGLTLLELVIVLTILVAVGGIAVAIFPQFLTRAHTSTCAANIPELFKAIQMYDAMYTDGYPDRMDTLCVGGSLAGFMPADTGLVEHTLLDEEVAALNEAGINEVTTMIEDPGSSEEWHSTFWPYADGDPGFTSVSAGMTVATLSEANAEFLGLETGKTYTISASRPCSRLRTTRAIRIPTATRIPMTPFRRPFSRKPGFAPSPRSTPAGWKALPLTLRPTGRTTRTPTTSM